MPDYRFAARVADTANQLLHGKQNDVPDAVTGKGRTDKGAGHLASLINAKVHGQPVTEQKTGTEKGYQEKTWKAAMTKTLMDITQEHEDEIALDREIKLLEKEIRR